MIFYLSPSLCFILICLLLLLPLTLHKYLNRLYAIAAPVCVAVSHPQLPLPLSLSALPHTLPCDFVVDCLHNALAQKPIAEWLSLALGSARSLARSVCLPPLAGPLPLPLFVCVAYLVTYMISYRMNFI